MKIKKNKLETIKEITMKAISKIILIFLAVQLFQNSNLSKMNVKYIAVTPAVVVTAKAPKTFVTATMYNAVESQCDADPLVTAGMYRIVPEKASQHKYVALSRNLLKRWGGEFDYGDFIKISGATDDRVDKDGIYKVVDTMNKRFVNTMDILETSGTSWYKFEDVSIRKVSL